MTFKARPYLAAVLFVLAAIGGETVQPAIAGETLTIGGTGGALGAMKLLGSAFEKSHPDIAVVVLPSLGTSGGIKAVAKGAIDIGLSGRPLTNDERRLGLDIAECARTPLALAVRTGSPLSGLGRDQFVRILGGGAGAWLQGQRMRPILRPVNDTESILIRKEFPEIGAAIEQTVATRVDATVALTSQEAANLIEKIPGAIGFVPLGLIRSERRQIKVLPFDGVLPSAENVANGSYPLVMDICLVTRPDAPERVRKFVEFVASGPGRRILEESGNFAIGKMK